MTSSPATLRDAWQAGTSRLREAGIDDARFEAEVLLRHASGRSRADLYTNLTDPLDSAARLEFEAALARRTQREPLAYITGRREFFKLDFLVTPAVLIPRPESELLVERALAHLRQQRIRNALVVDVGTGSGALGLAIAKHRRNVRLIGIDTSREALAVAARNGVRLLPRQPKRWVQGDLLTAIAGPIDCVVANLPYIPEARLPELELEIAEHEPRRALTPGVTGSELILRLVTQLGRRLATGGVAVLEIDPDQAPVVTQAAERLIPLARIQICEDLGGQPRAVQIVAE